MYRVEISEKMSQILVTRYNWTFEIKMVSFIFTSINELICCFVCVLGLLVIYLRVKISEIKNKSTINFQ